MQILHGHRYVIEVTAQSKALNEMGMVVDFGLIKERVKSWVDDNFDHNVILSHKDHMLGAEITRFTNQKIYYLHANPTAENIALHLKHDIIPQLFSKESFEIMKLKLFETPNCFVEV